MSLLKSTGIIILILLLIVGTASASLTAPTTYSIGYKIWGKYWDLMGELGIRNGTIGGEGNNITLSYAIIKDSTLQNITIQNGTSINITTLNATNIAGNGSQLWNLNASNLTNPLPAINASALFGLNMSNQTRCTGNATCTYHANGSVSLDAVSNNTAIFNQILNTTTVTVGRNTNGSVELTASATSTTTNTSIVSNATLTTSDKYMIFASAVSGNITIVLPKTPTAGQEIIITKTDSSTLPVKVKPYYPFATATELQASFGMNTGNDYYTPWEATDTINVSAILFLPASADVGTTDTLAIYNSGTNGLPSTQLITSAAIPEGLDNYWTYINLTVPLNYVLLNKSSRYWIKHTESTNGRGIWTSADPTTNRFAASWINSTVTPIYVFANLTGISGYTGNTTGGTYGNSSLFYPSSINGTNQGNISNQYNRMNIITDGTNWYW